MAQEQRKFANPLDPIDAPTQAESLPHPPVDEEDALQRAIMSDFERAHRIEAQVDLSPYAGEHIAILNGKIVGHGPDLLTLQHECAVANGVPEHRIVTLGVFPPEILVR